MSLEKKNLYIGYKFLFHLSSCVYNRLIQNVMKNVLDKLKGDFKNGVKIYTAQQI